MSPPAPRWRAAWLAYAAFVVYGSLVPLDFQPRPWSDAVQAFAATPWLALGVQSRADWVANGVLYLPLGLLGALALSRGRAGAGAALLSVGLAWALALGVEFTQLFFPPRTVSLNDLFAEGIGSLIGAALSPWVGGWLQRARTALGADPARLLAIALPAYALAYGLYAFFPYDLLLSRGEWADKLAGDNVAWLVARPEGFSLFRLLLLLGAETVMAVPLGVWAAQRGASWRTALAIGLGLGVVLELGQLAVASGVSQGVSVPTRALGMAVGAAAWPFWQAGGQAVTRRWIDRHAVWLVWPWFVLLLLASGWRPQAWGGLARAELNWAETRLQPFYYHYWTTEAIALASVMYVLAMYAPLAVLAWARGSAPLAAGLLAALLALFVETGKLFFHGIRPDPTNLLLAGVAVWALVHLARWQPGAASAAQPGLRSSRGRSSRSRAAAASGDGARTAPAVAVEAPPAATAPVSPAVPPTPAAASLQAELRTRWKCLLPALPFVVVAGLWPSVGPLLALLVALAAAAVWWRPLTFLAVVPLALVVDFAPWSGRFFVDEFDLIVAAAAGVAWWRTSSTSTKRGRLHASTLAFVAFGASLVLSTAIGIGAAAMPWDLNLLSHYHSPLNGLRIAKGALWAVVFCALYRRLVQAQAGRAEPWTRGVAAALLVVVALVLWERLAFVGNPFDFAADYRVTGPFSAMNKGGAYIECFIAVTSAFVAAAALGARGAGARLGLALLLAAAGFAVAVTYSRNGWAAYAVVLAATAVFGLRRAWGRRGGALGLLAVLGLAVAAAVPVLGGDYAQGRLAQTQKDLDVRVAHWRDALSLRGGSMLTAAFGAGVGRFPEMHFWNSREPRAASFLIEPGDGNRFLRLGSGAPVYIDQIVSPPGGQELELTINVRTAAGDRRAPQLKLVLCRKWMLTSSDCEEAAVGGLVMPGFWQTQQAQFAALPAPTSLAERLAPIKLAIVTPDQGRVVEVDNVHLRAKGGSNLLANGAFENGMDHWFFATDLDPPWHIHSLPVSLLFDQGWLGLITGAALALVALVAGLRAAWRGSLPGLAALSGLAAFGVSGSLNTLIDEPRFLFLALVLAWLACYWERHSRGEAAAPGARR